MDINVRDFLNASYNHGYITIANDNDLGKTLWEGKFETSDNCIPSYIAVAKVVKWGIENNGIVIYIKCSKEETNNFVF
jgi:hypothetical protein